MNKAILTCLLLLVAVAGRAQESVSIDGIIYLLDNGKASVMQQSGLTGDIVIPETVRHNGTDYTVTSVQNNAFTHNDITSIVLPNTVSVMGDACFSSCINLVSVTLPAGLTSLGNSMFSSCFSLTSIDLPHGLVSIGGGCFSSCYNIKSVILPDGVKELGDQCFRSCMGLESVTLPDGLVSMGYGCFSSCISLKSVDLPNSITSLGDDCFSGCSSLKSVVVPGSVGKLGKKCFSSCDSLESVVLSYGIKELGENCFYECKSLKSVTLPDGLTDLRSKCFLNCTSLSSITLPNSLTNIESRCFENCSQLKSVTLPEGITQLNNDTFSECSSLVSIKLPESIIGLGSDCFSYCTSLVSITLPAGIQTLGGRCFYGCSSLGTILLPGSIQNIAYKCFTDCTYLTDVTCEWENPADVQAASDAFGDIYSECRLHVPSGTTSLYKATEPWSTFKYIIEDGGQVVDPVKCAAPVITYDDNGLVFSCETEGAEYHYSIMASDAVEDGFSADGRVSLGASYGISVYASAEGYLNSDVVKATLCFINAELNTSGISLTEQRGIVVSTRGGVITISGLADGEQVAVYSLGGVMLSSGRSMAGSVTLNAGGAAGVVIVKTAGSSIKVRLDD